MRNDILCYVREQVLDDTKATRIIIELDIHRLLKTIRSQHAALLENYIHSHHAA